MTNPKNEKQQKRRLQDNTAMIYGKVPPQAVEVERAVLGTLLLFKDGYDQATELISAESFYTEGHQSIFEAMTRLQHRHQPIDILTVKEELARMEKLEIVGGDYYITSLTNNVVSDANLQNHCRILYEKYVKRQLIWLGGQMVSEAYEDPADAFDLMDKFEQQYQVLTQQRNANNITGLDSELVVRFKRIVELQKLDTHLTGIPSGYEPLDRITHGWQNTDLIILAARPAVGKTAFALNLARNAARAVSARGKKRKVLLFSLEMSKGQLVDRMMAAESEVALDKIMTGHNMDEAHLQRIYRYAVQPMSDMGIYIDDTPALNVYELRAKARYSIRKYGDAQTEWLIVIDYLQLMSGVEDRKINNREQEISNISRNLKKLAKEMNIPIIALSQLSREVEKRKGEKQVPRLSDLRDSGAIEQDADMVMFMYRPEYYDISVNEMGENTQGETHISIAKHRNGALETIKLRALLHIQKFIEWDGAFEDKKITLSQGNWRPVTTEEKGDHLPFN